jgi:hypothetical protein
MNQKRGSYVGIAFAEAHSKRIGGALAAVAGIPGCNDSPNRY